MISPSQIDDRKPTHGHAKRIIYICAAIVWPPRPSTETSTISTVLPAVITTIVTASRTTTVATALSAAAAAITTTALTTISAAGSSAFPAAVLAAPASGRGGGGGTWARRIQQQSVRALHAVVAAPARVPAARATAHAIALGLRVRQRSRGIGISVRPGFIGVGRGTPHRVLLRGQPRLSCAVPPHLGLPLVRR